MDPHIMNLVQVLHTFVTSKTQVTVNDTIVLGTNPVIPSRQIKINQSKKLEKCKCVFYGLNRVLSWLCRLPKKSFVRFVVSLGSFTGLKSSLRSLKLVRLTCSKSTGFAKHSRTPDFLNKDWLFFNHHAARYFNAGKQSHSINHLLLHVRIFQIYTLVTQ